MDNTEFDRMMDEAFAEAKSTLKGAESDPPATLKDVLKEVKKQFNDGVEKMAKEHGVPVSQIHTELIVSVFTAIMFGHHVRKGNVTKTIYWGFAGMNQAQSYRARWMRELVKKNT